MLVLSRKKSESIKIRLSEEMIDRLQKRLAGTSDKDILKVLEEWIDVTVVEIRGDKVRLGITAPKEVPVHRKEVFDVIHDKPTPSDEGPILSE